MPKNKDNNNYEKIKYEESEIINTPVPTINNTIKIPVSGELVLPKGIGETNED